MASMMYWASPREPLLQHGLPLVSFQWYSECIIDQNWLESFDWILTGSGGKMSWSLARPIKGMLESFPDCIQISLCIKIEKWNKKGMCRKGNWHWQRVSLALAKRNTQHWWSGTLGIGDIQITDVGRKSPPSVLLTFISTHFQYMSQAWWVTRTRKSGTTCQSPFVSRIAIYPSGNPPPGCNDLEGCTSIMITCIVNWHIAWDIGWLVAGFVVIYLISCDQFVDWINKVFLFFLHCSLTVFRQHHPTALLPTLKRFHYYTYNVKNYHS